VNLYGDMDTSLFTQMCREMAQRLDKPDDTILREETGRIFNKAIENTDAADVGKIRARSAASKFSLQPTALYTPKQPGRRHLRSGKVLYNLSYRFPAPLWNAIQAARAKDVKVRIAARGLAKQSWYKIAILLGLGIEAPAYVKKAIASTGKEYSEDEKATVIRAKGQMGYEFENAQPTVNAIGGERALQQAIDGRVEFFLTNVSKGVFDDLARVAKKYPGIEIE